MPTHTILLNMTKLNAFKTSELNFKRIYVKKPRSISISISIDIDQMWNKKINKTK